MAITATEAVALQWKHVRHPAMNPHPRPISHRAALAAAVQPGQPRIPGVGELRLDGLLGRAGVAGGDQGAGQVGDQPGVPLLVPGQRLPVGRQGMGIAGTLAQALLVGTALDRLGELGVVPDDAGPAPHGRGPDLVHRGRRSGRRRPDLRGPRLP